MIIKVPFFVRIIYIGMLLCVLPTCMQNNRDEIVRGIYYWKTNFALSHDDFAWLKDTGIKKLYVRFFDVDWNPETNAPVPVGEIIINTKWENQIEIIPVIFITNRTLINIPDSLLPQLSRNIFQKIFNKLNLFGGIKIQEIQLDCDWSKLTEEKYFELIRLTNRLCADENIHLTSTIRLHQIKYFSQTGVPPVKRVKLMFYNMSDVSDLKTRNSIFDEEVAKQYLVNFDNYPLDIDVVLPAFSWVCHFRKNKLLNLMNDVELSDLESNPGFIKEGASFYKAVNNCYIKGIYVLRGDYLRIEQTDFSSTLAAAKIIAPHLVARNLRVSIYHFNNKLIEKYEKHSLENIFAAFN